MTEDHCPICLGQSLSRYEDAHWPRENHVYNLSRCDSCDSVFTNPLPGDTLLKNLYQTSFNYQWYADHLDAKLWDAAQRYDEYRPLLRELILDYGGGLGYFSQICRSKGHKSITYDPYTTNSDPTEKWHTLVALHMLEHSNKLDDTLASMKNLLVSRGQLILAVPNYAGLGYRSQGMSWVWAQPPFIHIFHFTAKGIISLLERHGFSDIKVSYHDRWDANTYCDIDHARWFRMFDWAWGTRTFNSIPAVRKFIAKVTSYARLVGLKQALQKASHHGTQFAELQVSAIAPLKIDFSVAA